MKRLLAAALVLCAGTAAAQVSNPPTLGTLGGMNQSGSNATLPNVLNNFGIGKTYVYGANSGMVCDNVFDNTSALQAAVNLARALAFPATGNGGGILVLPAGFCQITGAINITSGVTIIGAGAGSASGAGNSGGTVIRTNSTTADVFTVVTDQAVTFDNFGIDAPTVTKVSGSGINITLGGGGSGNKWSKITRMRISGMFDAVKLVDAQGWKIRDNQFLDFQHDGVLYAPDSSHADGSSAGGSSVISGNNFWDLNVGTSNAQFEVQGGGDIEVSNNKFVGGSLYGVLLNLQVGPTGTLLMSNNSFEEHKTANIALTQGVTTKEYANVAIIGNEFSNIANNPTSGNILIGTGTPNTAPKWIRNVNIVGNHTNDTVALTGGMIQINDGTGIAITGNVLNGNGTAGATGLSVGAAAANVSYTGNQPLGLASEFASSTMNWSAINFGAAPAPNLIRNGGIEIDQVLEGASVAAGGGGNTFGADGWTFSGSNSATGAPTMQRVTDAPIGAQHSLKYTVGTAGSAPTAAQFARFWQRIEANNLRNLGFGAAGAKTVTLSIWLKTSITGNYAIVLQNTGRTRSIFQNCALTAATWTECVFVIPGDVTGTWTATGGGIGAYMMVIMECGSNFQGTANAWVGADTECLASQTALTTNTGATFQISNAKLEVSSVPTPFVTLPFAEELAIQQRYYAKTFPQGTAVVVGGTPGLAGALCTVGESTTIGTLGVEWRFPVDMVAAPTIVTYNPSAGNANWRNVTGAADVTVSVDVPVAKGTTGVPINEITDAPTVASKYCIHATADARL
jgi:hypothetical protein